MDESEQTDKNIETLVYLDFSDKISNELLKSTIFIRIANIEDKNPLIQVNDMVFKGTYDYSIGTNLFFKKTTNAGVSEFPFQKATVFDLKFFESQTKILNCKQMRVPPTKADTSESCENYQYNLKWDYQELLDNFEQGILNIESLIEYDQDPSTLEERSARAKTTSKVIKTVDIPRTMEVEESVCDNTNITENTERVILNIPDELYPELKIKYNNLQSLARTPVKRQELTECVECDPIYKDSYDYKSIECKVLEPPLFSYINDTESKNSSISDCVDIHRCVRLGLIQPSNNFPRILTENEKKLVLTVENFKNLNLKARLSVIQLLTEELQTQVEKNNSDENSNKDEFGHTPVETLNIFKKLLFSLQKIILEIT